MRKCHLRKTEGRNCPFCLKTIVCEINYWMCVRYSCSWRPVIHLSRPAKNQVELSLSFWGSKLLFADEEQYHRTYMTDASLRTLRTKFDVFHDFFIISNLMMGWMVKKIVKAQNQIFLKLPTSLHWQNFLEIM